MDLANDLEKVLITPSLLNEDMNRIVDRCQSYGVRVLEVAESMGWEMVAVVPGEGRIEATDTTFWYGFKDDVVIRVAAEGTGTLVDLRSKSRVGRSDLGVNAARIHTYIHGLLERMGQLDPH